MSRRRVRDEAGSSSLPQVAIMTPVLLLVLMLIVQFSLVFHARSVARAAAQEASAAARRFDGSAGAGRAAGLKTLDALGPDMLQSRQVSVQRGPQTVTVVVTGTVTSLVPGFHPSIRLTANAPVERFAPASSP